jgi:surfactin synthase thioesterase subunit
MSQKHVTHSRWLMREPSPRSGSLLFMLPYLGAGTSTYHNWPRTIDGCEICPVRLPGREDRSGEVEYRSLGDLAEELADALAPYLQRPFALFGHYTFALLGYEVAAHLKEHKFPNPVDVFVSSQVSPRCGMAERFRGIPDGELAEEVVEFILEMGGNPLPSLVERYMRVLRFDLAAFERYQPTARTPADLRIMTIGWECDPYVSPKSMTGWRNFGPTSSHVLHGTHYSFLQAPDELLALISSGMNESNTVCR